MHIITEAVSRAFQTLGAAAIGFLFVTVYVHNRTCPAVHMATPVTIERAAQ